MSERRCFNITTCSQHWTNLLVQQRFYRFKMRNKLDDPETGGKKKIRMWIASLLDRLDMRGPWRLVRMPLLSSKPTQQLKFIHLFYLFILRIHLENFVNSLHWPTPTLVLVSRVTITESVLNKTKIRIRVRVTLRMVDLGAVKIWSVHAPQIHAKEMDFVSLSV